MRISTRTKYIAYIAVLHVVLVLLVYRLLFEDKLVFIASEIFLFLSAITSIYLYISFMQPIQFIRSGIEAIKEKDFSVKFVPTGKGEVDTLIEVYNLMIDQLREERIKLQEQHFFMEKLIEASPISIIVLDFDGQIASLNVKARSMFSGADSMTGLTLAETGHPLLQELSSLPDGESRVVKANGIVTFKVQRSHFMDRGFRRSFLMIEELTNELLESEKNAYGKVIRMMAHEVNNTLGATDSILQTTTQLLKETTFDDVREALEVASDRNRHLTRFMRNFADVVRLPSPSRAETDLIRLVRDVAVFMEPSAALKGVTITPVLRVAELKSLVDRGQIEHVLVNVLKNAIEACAAGNEIRIDVDTDKVVVSNNGRPIDPETSAKLFNPFFSTKKDGQGIGLTLTREILLNHGFSFSLKTGASGWTAFTIELH